MTRDERLVILKCEGKYLHVPEYPEKPFWGSRSGAQVYTFDYGEWLLSSSAGLTHSSDGPLPIPGPVALEVIDPEDVESVPVVHQAVELEDEVSEYDVQ